jgi:acetate kinase
VRVLVLNGGSSSFKCWFGELPEGGLPDEPAQPLWSEHSDLSHQAGAAETVLEPLLKALLKDHPKIDVVGHRIVHGGPRYRESTLLTPEVRKAIAQQVEFAPSHNRFELEAVRTADRVIGPEVPQIAVFDTGFHSTLEPAAYVYPGPYSWLEEGVRRYGFHGINHQYAAGRAAWMLRRDPASLKLISCHLGNGASLAAVRAGKSVDTTMGFTPLDGLMMGMRSGSIDPGILVYLIRHRGYTAEQLDGILNKESGLLGVSGLSGDMREILKAMDSSDQRARLAFDVYAHRLTREIGGMLAILGGVDALIFTGGVGENCVPLRQIVCERLAFLGLQLDASKNAQPKLDQDVATPDSKVRVLLIRANEEWQIAKECHKLISHAPKSDAL